MKFMLPIPRKIKVLDHVILQCCEQSTGLQPFLLKQDWPRISAQGFLFYKQKERQIICDYSTYHIPSIISEAHI